MTTEHAVNHLSSVVGVTLAVYALWSMILNPTQGPLPGTVLPFVVGVGLFAIGAALLAWGSSRIYGYE
jgi:predicted RNA methylase